MYITENQSIGESVLFMLSARRTLAEMVEDSGHKSANVMVNFLMNEATDLEILSLLVEGYLPDEKYNAGGEVILFSRLKEQALANSATMIEMMGESSFNDFMTRVDTVYPHMSTAGPMLEFFAAQSPEITGAMLLSEGPYSALAAKKAAALAKTGPLSTMSSGGKTFSQNAAAGKGAAISATNKAHQLAGGKGSAIDATTQRLSSYGKPDTGGGPAGFKPDVIKQTEPGMLAQIKAHIQSASDAVSAFAKTPAGHVVGGAAVAALLAYAAAKTYKRFFSKAAGACRGMSGGAKTDCMEKYRGRAYMAQAADLQRGMASCAKARNPESCKSAVGGKIERLKAKASKLGG